MSSIWFCAFTIVSTLVATASSTVLKTQDLRPNVESSLKQASDKGVEIPKSHVDTNSGVQFLPEEGLRFHQYPYSYPYAFLANNALSAVQNWKKPTSTTSSSTTPTTTTDWDDWDD